MMIKLSFRIWLLIIALLLAALMISPTFEKGVVIKNVEIDSVAFENGVRQGMKIKEINSVKIESMEEYSQEVSKFLEEENLSRIDLLTDEGEFIFLDDDLNALAVSEIAGTKIKTGLDLSGGARALVKAVNISLSDAEMEDLVSITSQRLNAFGLSDVNIRSVKDLEGNNYMLIEIAGATTKDIEEIVGEQGKFEAKIKNQTVFIGGEKDIR